MDKETIQSEELRAILLATTIYHDPGTRFRRAKALGDIIAKVLYLTPGRKAKGSDIERQAAKMIAVPRLATNDVIDALQALKDSGVVAKVKDGWLLKPTWVEQATTDIKKHRTQANQLLERYFGKGLSLSLLRPWFWKVTAAFCGRYGDDAVKILEGKTPSRSSIETFFDNDIPGLAKELGLDNYIETLKSGYRAFLADINYPPVYTQLWTMAQIAFSARLITASIGPDPVTSLRFNKARFFLDTNILIISCLETSKLAPALKELALSLHHLGASLHIIPPTREEYLKVVAYKRQIIPCAVEEFGFNPEILGAAYDRFYETAVARKCVSKENFDRFFDTISNPPAFLEEKVPIILEDTPAIETAIQTGYRDQHLQNEISSAWSLIWPGRQKTQSALRHDAALNAVGEAMRSSGINAWVLSADRAMQSVAVRRAGVASDPIWISLQSLVQILALLGAGPGHDPSNFAPLLARLIESEVHPRENDGWYDMADLLALNDDVARFKELSKEEMVNFARRLTRIRLTSSNPRDVSEVIVAVQRQLQRPRIDTGEVIRNADQRAAEAERNTAEALQDKNMARNTAIDIVFNTRVMSGYLKASALLIAGLLTLGTILYFGVERWGAIGLTWKTVVVSVTVTLIVELILQIPKQFRSVKEKARVQAEDFINKKMGNSSETI